MIFRKAISILLAAALLSGFTVCAYADTGDVPIGTSIVVNDSDILRNDGTVEFNEGRISMNNGYVGTNGTGETISGKGIIQGNFGEVDFNNAGGSIEENYNKVNTNEGTIEKTVVLSKITTTARS